jgi:hypothetical protein
MIELTRLPGLAKIARPLESVEYRSVCVSCGKVFTSATDSTPASPHIDRHGSICFGNVRYDGFTLRSR